MIKTSRLQLVPFAIETVRAALDGREALAAALSVEVTGEWPPEFLDASALGWFLDRLIEDDAWREWGGYFVLLPSETGRTLIGSAGFLGPPSEDGTVEIGYGLLPEFQRRGFGSESARALVNRAFRDSRVSRIVAETMPAMEGSIGLLRACGFKYAGEGAEPPSLRFEFTRSMRTLAKRVGIEELQLGMGCEALRGDSVRASYEMRLSKGDVVAQRHDETVYLHRGQTIAGLVYGLEGMREGGRRRIRIGSHLAYGGVGVPGLIPENALLIVEIELHEVIRPSFSSDQG